MRYNGSMKYPTSFRLSEATHEKLVALAKVYGTQSEVLAVAIDRLYTSTVSPQIASEQDATNDR